MSGDGDKCASPDDHVSVKWNGKLFDFSVQDFKLYTVNDLKTALEAKTQVPVTGQKLLGIKRKDKKPTISDETKLVDIDLNSKTRIIMMGQPKAVIEKVNIIPDDIGEIFDDFDIDNAVVPLQEREEFVNKIERRVKEYKIKVFNEPRKDKKLLVLDIDYTLYDHRSSADSIDILMRPFLSEFLTELYPHYDIVIWSATGMKWIEAKMKEMGLIDRNEFKFTFFLDSAAMISVHTESTGLADVKPLAVIWGKFPEFYSKENTVMLDDIRRNFLMNPENGLKIRPYKQAHSKHSVDRELLQLAEYLKLIARKEKNFTTLNHSKWERYVALQCKSVNHRELFDFTRLKPEFHFQHARNEIPASDV